MDAKELRIGNWVIIDDGFPERVTTVTFNIIHYFPERESMLKPIPLTPEILEKAGFEESQDGFFYNEEATFRIHNNRMLIDMSFINPENDETYFVNIGVVDSLHQLQNLYHALTSEELTISLT